MAAVEVGSAVEKPVGQTFCILGGISFVSICVYHGLMIKKNYGNEQYNASKYSLYFSLILIIFGGLLIILVCFETFNATKVFCDNIIPAALPSYILFKLTLYLLLVHRLYYVFQNLPNELKYSTKKLKIWCILIICLSIISLILTHIDIEIVYDDNMYPPCDVEASEFGLMFMALQDIICGIINCYLFVRPIKKLRNKMNNITTEYNLKTESKSTNILGLAIKNCILVCCAILSTVIGLIGIILIDMAQIWISIDTVITILSVVFMYEWNLYILNYLCCCCLPNNLDSNKDGLEMAATIQSKTKPEHEEYGQDEEIENITVET